MTTTQEEPVVVPAQVIIGPRRYVQGRGVMAKIGEYLAPLGEQVMVLADPTVWGLVEATVRASLAGAGIDLHHERFGGQCSAREIDRVARLSGPRGLRPSPGSGAARRWTPQRRPGISPGGMGVGAHGGFHRRPNQCLHLAAVDWTQRRGSPY